MTADERLVQIVSALARVKLPILVMGGHAVRHYGVNRDTFDFDSHISLTGGEDLAERLLRARLIERTRNDSGVPIVNPRQS